MILIFTFYFAAFYPLHASDLVFFHDEFLRLAVVRAQKGETPDSKSRALQQLAKDFGSQCNSIAKSLGKKGGEAEASAGYDKASTILAQYLQGVELDPLGSQAYN